MSRYTDLIARLRDHGYDVTNEAADVIEALEVVLVEVLMERVHDALTIRRLTKRIAELEAGLS